MIHESYSLPQSDGVRCDYEEVIVKRITQTLNIRDKIEEITEGKQ
jgi:hypothetical protein